MAKNNVTQEMYIEIAKVKTNITQYDAEAQAQSRLLTAQAQADTFFTMQDLQAKAYHQLQSNLSLTNNEVVQYLQINMIKNYPQGNLVISIADTKSAAA